jgi:hypothetical protein
VKEAVGAAHIPELEVVVKKEQRNKDEASL